MVFNKAECYYMPEVSSGTAAAELEQTNLEFLRYVGFVPLRGPTITLENEVNVNSGVNPPDEGLMSQ